jgi:hypothetical protein
MSIKQQFFKDDSEAQGDRNLKKCQECEKTPILGWVSKTVSDTFLSLRLGRSPCDYSPTTTFQRSLC